MMPVRSLVLTAVIALALAASGVARAQGPLYVATPPTKGALYTDGQGGRYLLGGAWLYRADRANVGQAQGWWRGAAATDGWSPVSVPNSYNAGDLSQSSMSGYLGWYRKDFTLPANAFPRFVSARDQHWIVRFESVNYRATVWLNGRQIGTHVGAYLPFELDLTGLRRGVNRLIIRVDDRRSPSDLPPGPGGLWWNYGGLQREVYLRSVARVDIANAQVRPLLPCPTCAATISEQADVRNTTGARQTVHLRGTYGTARVDFGTARIAPHATWVARASVRIAHPNLWAPGHPTLYRASMNVTDSRRRSLASYLTYSGIRSITIASGGRLELNGRIVHLRGVSFHEQDLQQGAALDSAHLRQLMTWAREAGSTVIRVHYPFNQQIQEMADRYGVLIWSEVPVYQLKSTYLAQPAVIAHAHALLQQNILTNQNHPSVLLWSIGNELTTPPDGPESRYIAGAAALAHKLDPTRPVGMAISDWPGVPCEQAYAPLDAIGFNDYFGWFDAAGGATDDRDALGPFLDGFHACYPAKALFVSEFGFEGNRHGPVEERGTYEFQNDAIQYHLRVFASKPWLAGAIYWTLQDFAAEPGWGGGDPWPDPPFVQKGLLDAAGNPKSAFGIIAASYRATTQIAPIRDTRSKSPRGGL
jgi:glycosyl hydrolase family 2